MHPDKVGIWIFNCSSAHEGYATDALNFNNINVHPGGKQKHLCDTVIPLNNPSPKPGHTNTQGLTQTMVYPLDHPDLELWGKPKRMKAVLQEHKSVWDELESRCKRKAPVGKCSACMKSQVKKDAEWWVAQAEAMGAENTMMDADCTKAKDSESKMISADRWCCISCVLSLQEDFVEEKPLLQHYLKGQGHVCMFLLKFYCKINLIEILWGYVKYHMYFMISDSLSYISCSGYCNASDSKFTTAKFLVPQCLDLCNTTTIHHFFCNMWQYMDAYR